MRKRTLISLSIVLVMLFSISSPVSAYAQESSLLPAGQLNTITLDNNLITGSEDSEKRFNLMLNTETGLSQFALVYFDKPDFLYEFWFDIANH